VRRQVDFGQRPRPGAHDELGQLTVEPGDLLAERSPGGGLVRLRERRADG
jgi:hypothetical protein